MIGSRPLVLVGDCWPPVVKAWQDSLVVSDEDVSWLDFAKDGDEASSILLKKTEGVIL